MKTIYLAGGCFWGVQKHFDRFEGVMRTEVGYANSPDAAPSYEEVCRDSGHAETLKIDYDETRISLTELLGYYFLVIDPLAVNRQGHDEGIQYRTGIYYTDAGQLPEIEEVYREQEQKAGARLAVELEPLANFFSAEEYHQKYLEKNPGGYCHIPQKMFSLKKTKKTLIVYFSLEGNTAYAAGRIAGKLNTSGEPGLKTELLRIEPVKAFPSSGFRKFLWGGKSAVMAETPALVPYEFDASAYDRIIFGFPVWAGNITPPIRSFVKENKALLSDKHISAFACQSGSGAERAFGRLCEVLGLDHLEAELVLIDPKSRPSEENDRRIEAFCEELKKL